MKWLFLYFLSAFFGLPLLVVSYAFIRVVFGFDGTFTPQETAECGIVFGASVHAVDHPGPGILRRVDAAVGLYENARIESLIFAGGKGSETQESEAAVMRDVALSAGIAPEDVQVEERSSSTWENIAYSRPLLDKCASIVAISDRYHLARIQLIASKQGIAMETYPAAPVPRSAFEVQSTIREAGGYLLYVLEVLP